MDLAEISEFRGAVSSDIVEGGIVFLISDYKKLVRVVIDEVYNPNSQHKAFCADDGCRYGLEDLYVLKNNNDYRERIQQLEEVIAVIKNNVKNI